MDLQLAGRRCFVSGSTQGIGRAVARALLGEGASVIVNGRTESTVQATVEELAAEFPGTSVSGIAADLERPGDVERLLASLGDIDVLVNNVGLFDVAPFDSISDEDWYRYIEVNLMSGMRLSRQVLGGMLTRNSGRIIFIGTESAVNVPADMLHYGVTKAAQLALSNGLAKLTAGTAVTVNTVLGGPTYSDGVSRVVERLAEAQGMPAGQLKAAISAGNRTSLLQRFIEPAEIADLVLYLASPRSSATNGAALRADGGVLTSTT